MENVNTTTESVNQQSTPWFNKQAVIAELKKPETIVKTGIAILAACVAGYIAKK